MRHRLCFILSIIGLVSISAGCAENKLTRQNFDTIVEGASNRDEVRHTLGDDYVTRSGNEWEYEDENHNLSVLIRFDESGKVTGKEWRDATSGTWEGQADGINPNPPGRKVSESNSTTTIHK